MNTTELRRFLDRYGLLASKDRGQNFLVDEELTRKLVDLAGVEAGDSVLEVGTGVGILTRALAQRGASVTSIEIDSGLVRALREEELLPPEVNLIHGDFLSVNLQEILENLAPPRRLVANLPYSISSQILRRILDHVGKLTGASVLLQKEMARRISARPGDKDYGSLSVLHQLVVKTKRLLDIHPRCFYPVPKVTSSFVQMIPLSPDPSRPGPEELVQVERVVRAAFGQRRKTLVNALGNGLEGSPSHQSLETCLEKVGIPVRSRAERVTPEQFLELTQTLLEEGL